MKWLMEEEAQCRQTDLPTLISSLSAAVGRNGSDVKSRKGCRLQGPLVSNDKNTSLRKAAIFSNGFHFGPQLAGVFNVRSGSKDRKGSEGQGTSHSDSFKHDSNPNPHPSSLIPHPHTLLDPSQRHPHAILTPFRHPPNSAESPCEVTRRTTGGHNGSSGSNGGEECQSISTPRF